MLSLYEILKASKTGIAPDMWTALAGANFGGAGSGAEVKELTGIPPLSFTANGTPLLDFLISGNMSQASGVSPTTPIQPSECGERTGNLFDRTGENVGYYVDSNGNLAGGTSAAGWTASDYIEIEENTQYTFNPNTTAGNSAKHCFYNAQKQPFASYIINSGQQTFTTPSGAKYARFSYRDSSTDIMLNTGSTPLPYEPYGIKIPISSANTTTPVYLGEVETTRMVKKLVLTGGEIWGRTDGCFRMSLPDSSNTDGRIISTHFEYRGAWSLINTATIGCCVSATYYGSSYKYLMIRCDEIATTTSDFKSYLAAQYAAGTPVCVWYVLATPETAVVNEPLRKIGDYADTVSYEQAGVQIPTLHGNTVIDVLTELKPSEMYIKYQE